jgi:hypothetical protein
MYNFFKPKSKNQTINGKTQTNRVRKRKVLNKMGRISRRINREK